MFNNIVKKIFVSVVGIFVVVMLVQLAFQNIFLEDIYTHMKTSKVQDKFTEFCDEIVIDNMDNKILKEDIAIYEDNTGAELILINEEGNVINEDFFEEFNYLMVKDRHGKQYRILVDFLIDEEGNYNNSESKISIGDMISVTGKPISGTGFVEVMQVDKSNISMVNEEAYSKDDLSSFDSTISDAQKIHVSGEVIAENLIVRNNGIYSYQSEKLYTELKQIVKEKTQEPEYFKFFLDERKYDFIEEYSGLMIVVLGRSIEGSNGEKYYAFSLFTLENIHDAFNILNGYYYYIFGFQFILLLILVFLYSKWITKPLIKMIDSAKSIAERDFSNKTSINTKDELSVLSESLNSIADNMSKTIHELELSNDQLAKEAIKKAENEERMRNMLTALSHEFKTPLGIISGFIEIIGDGVYEKEPKYYTDVIEGEIDKLNDLVQETIELSKLESGSYKLIESKFEIREMIDTIMMKFDKETVSKNLSYKNLVQSVQVIGDKRKIDQVVTNLLSNAIMYSPKGQSIEISSQVTEESLYIKIINYGVIIDDDDLKKIWDRFYRTEKSRNRSLGGSGLGLTIVKNILELHGSDYGVSTLENGVEFYFSLKKA